eukprot:CAMPEP_0170746416 /NCGR_PEP_ID=MMETSP0437-20130122/8798_1 /TAXON_ID=0 /ORGANISM="Sexangularia sp." /LENGTH=370 /DNA_ID=CAMNT_0011085167 /DNA_START=66 /DNA_END=1175 /DNA_ORIENTATION=-
MTMSIIIDNAHEKLTGKKPDRSTLSLQCHDGRTGQWVELPHSESVRFAGLTNRAKLKLVSSKPQAKRTTPAQPRPVAASVAASDVTATSTPSHEPMETDARPPSGDVTPAVSNAAPAERVSKSPTRHTKGPAGHPTDRMVVVYRPGQSKGPIVIPDVPDSFYELSTSDVQAMAKSTKRAVSAANDAPLMTREMRERAEARAASKRSPTTRLRLRFQDLWEVEATFLNNEKVGDVLDFIRHGGYLPDPAPASLHCFVTPPKVELRETMTLSKHNLCPSALVYVWYDGWHSSQPCLAEAVRASAVDREMPQAATSAAPQVGADAASDAAAAAAAAAAATETPVEPAPVVPSSAVRGTAPSGSSSKLPGVPKW